MPAEDYIVLAKLLNDESKDFKKILKKHLEQGVSLAKAKFLTLKELGKEYDESLADSPNNVLGLEYTKALLSINSPTEIYPVLREGGHNDKKLKKGITSALSIRNAIRTDRTKKTKKSLPDYVYRNLDGYPFDFDKIVMAKLITTTPSELAKIADCTEGLENRIKALSKDNISIDTLVAKATTKRYTSSRIRRILLSNLLDIKKDLVKDCLAEKLYAKVLAVRADGKDIISEIAKSSSIPLLTRKSDSENLEKAAKKAFETDVVASDLYNLISDKKENEHRMLIV